VDRGCPEKTSSGDRSTPFSREKASAVETVTPMIRIRSGCGSTSSDKARVALPPRDAIGRGGEGLGSIRRAISGAYCASTALLPAGREELG